MTFGYNEEMVEVKRNSSEQFRTALFVSFSILPVPHGMSALAVLAVLSALTILSTLPARSLGMSCVAQGKKAWLCFLGGPIWLPPKIVGVWPKQLLAPQRSQILVVCKLEILALT